MKFMVIEGNVVGGHRIEDLGVTVPYQDEVRVNFERASWSSDLSYSIEKGLVTKKDVFVSKRQPTTHQGPPQRTKTPTKAPKKKKPSPPPPSSPPQTSDSTEELREMNKHLMAKLDHLTDSQMMLMGKIAELLERPASNSLDADTLKEVLASMPKQQVASPGSQKASSGYSGEDVDDDPIEDDVIYIPSQIRSTKTKVSDVEVEEGNAKGSGVDKASAALAAMRKGKKKSRRNKKGDSDDSES